MNAPIDVSSVILHTPRLTLRPWQMSDVEDLYTYAKVDGVGQMAGWIPHKNREESRTILQLFLEGKNQFALEYQGKVIGSVGIEKYDEALLPEYADRKGREIGYVLSKDYWGQGLMPEAVQAVIEYLFQQVGLDFLVCCHYLENDQSRRVQEKCGFHHLKQARFSTRYGVEKEGWLSLLERDEASTT